MMENPKNRKWKVLTSEYLARKPWFTVRHETIALPDGRSIPDYYVFEYPDWVNVIALTDDGHCIQNPEVMRRALEYVKAFDGVIAQHAQDPRLTEGAQMNEGTVSAELGLAGWPAQAESAIIARDVELAQLSGGRLHVCHISTAEGVEVILYVVGSMETHGMPLR